MKRTCKVSINGESFSIAAGERLLSAALRRGLDLAYDCREGRCGTCVVRIDRGTVIGGETPQHGCVRACQAHVVTDLDVSTDDPAQRTMAGRVASIKKLSRDVVEVAIATETAAPHMPGQYFKLGFDGLPVRSFSPSVPLAEDDSASDRLLLFHVRQLPGGAVSSRLGTHIRPGSPVEVQGPYGVAALEAGLANRLVLVSGGTGFAPIWSIAQAALREWPSRPVVLVTGVRQTRDLYMADALQRIARHANVRLTVTVDEGPAPDAGIVVGRPVQHMPRLAADDIVHVAGPPPLVDAVSAVARQSGCRVHADAFVPATENAKLKSLFRLFGRAA